MPVLLCSFLEGPAIRCGVCRQAALERMNLSRLFQVRVTAEDDCETLSEQLLAASLKLERPPNNCVVFESTINGIAAAHNATMKVSSSF